LATLGIASRTDLRWRRRPGPLTTSQAVVNSPRCRPNGWHAHTRARPAPVPGHNPGLDPGRRWGRHAPIGVTVTPWTRPVTGADQWSGGVSRRARRRALPVPTLRKPAGAGAAAGQV